MDTLRSHEVAALSEALVRLYEPVALADFSSHLFSIVETLIPEAMMSFDQVSQRTGALRHARNFQLQNPSEWMSRLAVNLANEHPAVAYVRRGGTEPVLHLSDFLSQRQLRETALYHENYREPGIEHQVAVVLPLPGYIAGLAINRSSIFHPSEVTLIHLLRPHILRAHANARVFDALRQTESGLPQQGEKELEAAGLTVREREVLHWLAHGKRDIEIGIILGISHRTIHKHVQRVLGKLGVETRSAAAAFAAGL